MTRSPELRGSVVHNQYIRTSYFKTLVNGSAGISTQQRPADLPDLMSS